MLYVKERNQGEIEILKDTSGEIVLQVTNPLDPQVFDHPLTLKLSLDSPATLKRITQGDATLAAFKRESEILFDATPNGDRITLKFE